MPKVRFESGYPKWIIYSGDKANIPPHTPIEKIPDSDDVKILIKDEDALFALDDDVRKKEIQKDLKENFGKDIDLRKYKGQAGLGALEAYYEAFKNGNGSVDS